MERRVAAGPETKHAHYRLMYDLMALAFEGDVTRSATFMLGRDLSDATFPESGIATGWHEASHHGDDPASLADFAKINRYHVENLAYFLDQLKNIEDGDGSVLDHVLVLKGSNMGDPRRHAHQGVPVILAGGLDGAFRGNRHLVYAPNTQRTSNMLLSVVNKFGIARDSFGSSTEPLPLL
jgi:hypothetical protein